MNADEICHANERARACAKGYGELINMIRAVYGCVLWNTIGYYWRSFRELLRTDVGYWPQSG